MRRTGYLIMIALLCLMPIASSGQESVIRHTDVQIESDVVLHLIESGNGDPIVFVHGSTGDYSVWENQVAAFANEGFRAIAYSRHYNYPNKNKLQPNHSALVEAADLARLLEKLELPNSHIVGHSYGAYTALLFGLEHPDRMKTLTLAEPSIVPWLIDLPGDTSAAAKARHDAIFREMVGPMKAAFAQGNEEDALRRFFDFVAERNAIDKLPPAAVDVCRRNILELKALMASELRYPPVSKDRVRQLNMPILILSGNKSEDVGFFTDRELERLLPTKTSRRVILDDATHLMWSEKPSASRQAVLNFIGSQ